MTINLPSLQLVMLQAASDLGGFLTTMGETSVVRKTIAKAASVMKITGKIISSILIFVLPG